MMMYCDLNFIRSFLHDCVNVTVIKNFHANRAEVVETSLGIHL